MSIVDLLAAAVAVAILVQLGAKWRHASFPRRRALAAVSATTRAASPLARARGVAALAVPAFLAFTIPLIGFVVSLLLPLLASLVRSRLWPGISLFTSRVCSGLVVTGLWLPALVFLFSLAWVADAESGEGLWGSGATVWLLIPLCAPSGSARWVPALLAISAYLAGLAVSTVVRHPWPWVLGAWVAPLAYEAASRWLVDAQFVC
jgi:hypothetical protein